MMQLKRVNPNWRFVYSLHFILANQKKQGEKEMFVSLLCTKFNSNDIKYSQRTYRVLFFKLVWKSLYMYDLLLISLKQLLKQ